MSGLWNWCVRNPPSPWPPVAYHVTNIMSDPSTTFSGMAAGRSCTHQEASQHSTGCMQHGLHMDVMYMLSETPQTPNARTIGPQHAP